MAPKGKEQNKEPEEIQEKKPKRKMIRLIFVLVFLIVIVLVGGFFALRFGLADGLLGGVFGSSETEEEAYREPTYTYEMPEVVVNLAGERRQFLSVKFYVGYDDAGLTEELERRRPEIRDAVLNILWDKTAEEIKTVQGKEQLRQELLDTINGMLRQGEIRGVFFWHVMIQ